MRIRAAELADLPALQDVERAAGLCFGDIGMPEINEYQPLPLAELAVYQQSATSSCTMHLAAPPYPIAEPCSQRPRWSCSRPAPYAPRGVEPA
jgi:hypothetical protein